MRRAQRLLASLHRTDHRPWPVPTVPWTWRQCWRDLLFAHWPVSADHLRAHVPESPQLSEFDGTAWLGVVPFRMTGVMRRPLPDLPWLSAFPELNVRTYVEYRGRPGVWFFSLDATNALAVWAARRWFHLPYHRARMRCARQGDRVEYRALRRSGDVGFRGSYGPTSAPYEAAPGSLEHWLTERYCLFAVAPDGVVRRTEVHHVPWPLQRASAEIEENTMARPVGLPLAGAPVLLHFAERLDVVVWSPEVV